MWQKLIKFSARLLVNSTLLVVLLIVTAITLPIILFLSTILIAVVLSALLLFALFAYLYHLEDGIKRKVDERVVADRGTPFVLNNLPTDVIHYNIFPFLEHTELLTSTKCINKRLNGLVRQYYESNMLHDQTFRISVLRNCIQKEWNIDNSIASRRALYNCVSSSDVWNDVQKSAFRNQMVSLESKSILWTIYMKFLVYSNVSHWHDDLLSVLNIYKYGISLCCWRPRTFFKLLTTGKT